MLPITPAQVAAVLIAGTLEGIGVPWPGVVIVAAAGASAGGDWTAVSALALLFSVGYCGGALGQYLAGRLLGPVALGWLPEARRLKLSAMAERHGLGAVLWTRPLAIGNYVSLPAGIMRMPVWRFLLCTLIGIWPWAMAISYLGGLFGGQMAPVKAFLADWSLPLVILAGGLAAMAVLWRRGRSVGDEA
jgi:membrane protein DedA with SNARE-associated domain